MQTQPNQQTQAPLQATRVQMPPNQNIENTKSTEENKTKHLKRIRALGV